MPEALDELTSNLLGASSFEDPDKAGRAFQLSQRMDVPPLAALSDIDEAEKQEKLLHRRLLANTDPAIQAYLNSHPLAAAVSQDDLPALVKIANGLRRWHIPNPQDVFVSWTKGFGEGFGSQGFGEWAAPLAEMKPFGPASWATATVLGMPLEIMQRGFGGVLHGTKEGLEELLIGLGTEESKARSFAKEITGVVEMELMGAGGGHGPKIDAGRAMAARATEAIRAMKPYLKEGATLEDIPRGLHPLIDEAKIERARLDKAIINEALGDTWSSNTHERAEKLLGDEFVARILHDNPEIDVDAEAVRRLYGDEQPFAEDGKLGWISNILEQLNSGSDIRLSLKDWLTRVDKDFAKELMDDVRFRRNSFTINEIKELKKKEDPLPGIDEVEDAVRGLRRISGVYEAPPGWQFVGGPEPREGTVFSISEPVPFKLLGDIRLGEAIGMTTVRKALRETTPDIGILRDFADVVRDLINKHAGDTPVYVLSDAQFEKSRGGKSTALAYYDPIGHKIVIRESEYRSGRYMARIIYHEAAHAATVRVLKTDPSKATRVKILMDELKEADPTLEKTYGWKNEREFLAEIFSNPAFQKRLADMEISPELSRRLGVEGGTWLQRVWNLIADLLGIPRERRTAFEAGLSLGVETMQTKVSKRGEAQIAREQQAWEGKIRKVMGVDEAPPLFEDALARGMTKEQGERWQKLLAARKKADLAKQKKRAQEDLEREYSRAWRQAKPEILKEVAEEINQRPDVALALAIRTGEYLGGSLNGRIVLDSSRLSPEQIKALPPRFLKEGGLDPEAVASLFGYHNKDLMIQGLIDFEKGAEGKSPKEYVEKLIRGEADKRLRQRLGRTPEQIQAEAMEQVLDRSQFNLLHEDLLRYGTQAGKQAPLTHQDMVDIAREKFAEHPQRFADPIRFFQEAGKYGNKVEQAVLAGKWEEAYRHGEAQYIQKLLAKEAIEFVKEKKKYNRLEKRLSQSAIQGVDPEATAWIQALMLNSGVSVKNTRAQIAEAIKRSGFNGLADYLDHLEGTKGQEVILAEELVTGKMPQFDDMTVAQFRDFHEGLSDLTNAAQNVNMISLLTGRVPFAEVRADVLERLRKLPIIPAEKQMSLLHRWDAYETRIEEIMKDMDLREDMGPLWQIFSANLSRAHARRLAMFLDLEADLKGMRKTHGRRWQRTLMDDIQHDFWPDPYHENMFDMKRYNLINIALNWGSESSRGKLIEGYFGKLDREQYKETKEKVERLFDNLTKEDWSYVKAMWRIHEKYREPTGELEQRLKGRPPKWVEGDTIETKHGPIEGKYYPLIYDKLRSFRKREVKENEKNLVDGVFGDNYHRAATPQGRVKKRTGYIGTLSIDETLEQNMLRVQQTIHDLTYREAIIDANKILGDKAINFEMKRRYGQAYVKKLEPWLKDVANQYGFKEIEAKDVGNVLRMARSSLVLSALSFNYRLIMSPSVATTAALPGYAAQMLGMGSLGRGAAWELIRNYSKEVPYTMRNIDREMSEALARTMKFRPGLMGRVLDAHQRMEVAAYKTGFFLIGQIEKQLRAATFLQFFENAGREHKDWTIEQKAAYADSHVRERHGSQALQDLPEMLRTRNEAVRVFSVFMGFNSTMRNWARQIPGQMRRGEYKEAVATALGSVVIPAAFGALLYNNMTKDDSWWAQSAKAIPIQLLQYNIYGRLLSNLYVEERRTSDPITSVLVAGRDFWKDMVKAATKSEPKKWVKHAAIMAGMAGVPGMGMQAGRSGQAIYDSMNRRQVPRNLFEWHRKYLLTGERDLPRR